MLQRDQPQTAHWFQNKRHGRRAGIAQPEVNSTMRYFVEIPPFVIFGRDGNRKNFKNETSALREK